jgi:hypothetical protein
MTHDGCELHEGDGYDGLGIVASKYRRDIDLHGVKLKEKYRHWASVGASNKQLPDNFDHLQMVADLIDHYHKVGAEIKEIIICKDLLTPSGWDMIKLIFPERDFVSNDQGNLIIENKPSPFWGNHIPRLLNRQPATAPPALA